MFIARPKTFNISLMDMIEFDHKCFLRQDCNLYLSNNNSYYASFSDAGWTPMRSTVPFSPQSFSS